MKQFKLLSVLIFISLVSKAQFTQYIIELKDKAGSPFSISRPSEFLSQRAIDRRNKQNIPIVDNDLPVNLSYIDSIRNAGDVTIKNVSKWLNQVCIETTDPLALQKIGQLPFIKSTQPSRRTTQEGFLSKSKFDALETSEYLRRSAQSGSSLNYGVSEKQITIHKGDFLHDKGYRGKGMLIAVIDDGFYHYKSLPAFDSLRADNRIIDTFDFVGNKNGLNEEDSHGMSCLSLIAANVPGQMIGSAPGASFLLYRSENADAEYLSEEQNWVAAAERSDSAGADVITTSLGYNTFDNPLFNHTYADMNGKTAIITKGAVVAASKGIVLLVAAGNEGNKAWHYITAPGDATNILTVGAVDISGKPGAFSSYGPTADGRVKPDVSSVGVATFVQAANGSFQPGNGTSFATPNLAGLVTCFWQAFPDFTAAEIMDAVRKSSSKYSNPDDQMGYGIPNFEIAYNSLDQVRIERQASKILQGRKVAVFPNPMRDVANVLVNPSVDATSTLRLFDMTGKLCLTQTETFTGNEVKIISLKRNGLSAGIYILRFQIGKESFSEKIVLQ